MDIVGYLESARGRLLDAAAARLARAGVAPYSAAGPACTRERLGALFDALVASLEQHDLGPALERARTVAAERFEAGFSIAEVQVAFNALEEAVWLAALERLPPAEFAQAIGPISTVAGAAKDALARSYVELAAQRHAPAIDASALLAGDAA